MRTLVYILLPKTRLCPTPPGSGKSTNLTIHQNRHHNLTPTLRIARNMPRESQHIRHDNSLLLRSRRAANALPELDLLARGLSLERPEEQDLIARAGVCS